MLAFLGLSQLICKFLFRKTSWQSVPSISSEICWDGKSASRMRTLPLGGVNFITFYRDGGVLVEPLALDAEIIRELQSNLLLYFTGSAHHSWAILKRAAEGNEKPYAGCT